MNIFEKYIQIIYEVIIVNDKKDTKRENWIPSYCTLGLADPNTVDEKTKATSPSLASVEQTREWSIENKL